MRPSFRMITFLLLMLPTALAAPVAAAVPTTTAVEGVLTASGGVPASDGTYEFTFALYAAASGGTALWSEGPLSVKVASGRFHVVLGNKTPLSGATLAAAGERWLGIQVGSDPELPRSALTATPYALAAATASAVNCTGCITADQIGNGAIAAAKLGFNFAGSTTKGGPALDLACTGCVSASEMLFDGDIDLGGNSFKAKNGTFSGDVVAKSVTATSFLGDGSKLTGIPTPTGSCPKGQAMKGIAADGTLLCQDIAGALPADGLDEISNGLLANQFVDTVETSDKAMAIPDNTGNDAVANLDFPDIGTAQTFELAVNVANTDLSTVSIKVLPPDDKKTGWTLCDPCGAKDAKTFEKTFSVDAMPKSGNPGDWIGQNPKGLWTLKVLDTSYCIVQAPGNAALCDTEKKTDGSIINWSIKIQTLSNKKVAAKGIFQATNGLQLQVADKAPVTCSAATLGYIYYDAKQRLLMICNGVDFDLVETLPGGVGSKGQPAKSCKEILTLDPGAKSGIYWLDPDGAGPGGKSPVYCEHKAEGGGWVLVMQLQPGHTTTFGYGSSHWTSSTVTSDVPPSQLSSTSAKYEPFNSFKTADGQLMLRDKSTGKTVVLEVPSMAGTTLLDRFQKLGGGAAYNQNQGVQLKVLSGAGSPQELMGYAAPTKMCSQFPAKWRMNYLSSHSGARIGNDVATNNQTTDDPSSWPCYDTAKGNLSYSGVGGTLESGRQWQDSYGSESLNRYRSNGGTGQGSQKGVEIFVR
ncbi:MAG: hypothetical protein H6747_04115 [Deltaproteobacteria bacterium]|nr:hypothetical protein [Deltaproteobacteria bacterium]